MHDQQTRTAAERPALAAIAGITGRHVGQLITRHRHGWDTPSDSDLAPALAELVQRAAAEPDLLRPDLLAEQAGLLLGTGQDDDDVNGPRKRVAARICLAAGADPALTAAWTQTGRARALRYHGHGTPAAKDTSEHPSPGLL